MLTSSWHVTLAVIDYINLLISSSLISNFSRQKNPFELFWLHLFRGVRANSFPAKFVEIPGT